MRRRGVLKRAGEALHVSAMTKDVIIRCESPVKPGVVLYDSRMEAFGKIIEIFGPVSSPYASVEPFKKSESVERQPLYSISDERPGKLRRHD